jgi:hypothetical protein
MRPFLLLLIPTLALIAADAAPGLAVWDAGSGTIGTEPGARGLAVRPGTTLMVSPDSPARIVLPGTANGYLTLAAGSTVTLVERRVSGSGTTAAELLITITTGAVAVGGDIAPRFSAVRLRGLASESVAAPGVALAVEANQGAGDTVVALDGPVGTGPLPGKANGWQAVAERVTLAPRTMVTIDPQRGVGEPVPAPRRPQLTGPVASRPGLRNQVAESVQAVDAWTLDAAARDLGLPDPAWWTAPPALGHPSNAAAAPAAARSWSALVQLSGFSDSNPNGVATDLGAGVADTALSLYGDARWTCWSEQDYAVRLQAVGGLVHYRGVMVTDEGGVEHDSRDKNQQLLGLNAALIRSGETLDWSLGFGGGASAEDGQDRRALRLNGDLGGRLDEDVYAVLNLGWAHSRIHPTQSEEADYTTRLATARPALAVGLSSSSWSSIVEASVLCSDSRSTVAADDFAALRPGISWTARMGRLDLGLTGRAEFIRYRAVRATSETTLARETVSQGIATADWWFVDWWSVGLFGSYLRFGSNQDLSAYTQTQVGARTTLHW